MLILLMCVVKIGIDFFNSMLKDVNKRNIYRKYYREHSHTQVTNLYK